MLPCVLSPSQRRRLSVWFLRDGTQFSYSFWFTRGFCNSTMQSGTGTILHHSGEQLESLRA